MTEYAALLRGVSPLNAKMSELKKSFEQAGFKDVRTILGTGNVRFSAPPADEAAIERRAEAAMARHLGRTFFTIVRPLDALRGLLESDPYKAFMLKSGSKRVVTFLREKPKTRLKLPIELDGARILSVRGTEIFSAYVFSPRGPVFMSLLEKTFGKDITTRTWDSVARIAKA
jgi:uncharacterized protein (DUF1697 family)